MVSWEVEFSEDKEDVINVENDHAETSEDIFGTSTTSNELSEFNKITSALLLNELSEFNKITSALLLSIDNNTFGYTIERNPVRYKESLQMVLCKINKINQHLILDPIPEKHFEIFLKNEFR